MDEKSFFWPVFFILAGTAALMVNFGVLPPESWRLAASGNYSCFD